MSDTRTDIAIDSDAWKTGPESESISLVSSFNRLQSRDFPFPPSKITALQLMHIILTLL